MMEAARLARLGKFRCFRCKAVGKQEEGLVVAFAGAVLLAIHPECMDGQIILKRGDGQIEVTMPKPNESSVILTSALPQVGQVAIATPSVTEVPLDALIAEGRDE